MMSIVPPQAIIFDMDNTIIQSTIDFTAMKKSVFGFLQQRGLLPGNYDPIHKTSAQLIEEARTSSANPEEWLPFVWEVIAEIEKEGMREAGLEPGAENVLKQLHGRLPLVILTNNAYEAAITALRETGTLGFFDHVVGREQMVQLKPSPTGVLYIHKLYPHLEPSSWLSVGDSWIDGKAAIDAGSRFLAYRGSPEDCQRNGIHPVGWIEQLKDVLHYL